MKIKHVFLFALFIVLGFTACQDEVSDISSPNVQESIIANSALVTLMSNTTSQNGAADDILDGASCLSVQLPVTIIVSDITIVINTAEDLETLEDLLEDLDDNEGVLDLIFPITIIFSDYSELVIENEDELQTLINQCEEENDSIECVDFIYPISFSVFDSEFVIVDTVIVDNDEALYMFLSGLEDNENTQIVSLNYPVGLQYVNGETIEVNTNQELSDAIEMAEANCDDDFDDCLEDEIALNLIECPWEVYLYSNNDFDNLDGPYTFMFSENGELVIDGITDQPHNTTWELSETDLGIELNIASFYYFEQQFGNWLVVECDSDELKLEHLTVEGTGLFFDQDCEDDIDCSITDISSILQECPWDFIDGTGNFANYQIVFNDNGELLITEGMATSAIGGVWSLSSTDNGIIVTFSDLTAFQNTLEGDWLITQCSDDNISILRGNTTIVLDQDCEGDLDCSSEQISNNLIECGWALQTNLIDSVVPIYMFFSPNGEILASNVINAIQLGAWTLVEVGSDIFVEFTYQQGFEVLNGQWQVVECEDYEFNLVNGGNSMQLLKTCETNNQALLDCVSYYVLSQECDADNDGIAAFTFEVDSAQTPECIALYTIISSSHPTYDDAVNNTNLLSVPVTQPLDFESQTIYFRVFSEVTQEYAVQELELIVESCNEEVFDCFAHFELVECANDAGEAEFNLSADTIGLVNCNESFTATFHNSLADAQNDTNAISNTESYWSVQGEVYLRINADGGNFEVFTVYLNAVTCNVFSCFESFDALIELCDDNNDGIEIFDLTIAFANCTLEADNVGYYETLADANAGANLIANPQTYTNVLADQQTVFTRVEIGNAIEIFEIQLIVANCSTTCTESFVVNSLIECIWNAVSYNGSDNLAVYNFDFESSSQIVVIYTNDVTIDANWSVSQTSDGVIVSFSNVAGPNIQAITGDWLVIECENGSLELHRGDDILVLQSTCD